MNKIKVVNDKLEFLEKDNKVDVRYHKQEDIFAITTIEIETLSDAELFLDICLSDNTKLKIIFKINHNIKIDILCHGNNGKIKYLYDVASPTCCHVLKYNSVGSINEMVCANLNSGNCTLDYTFKSISTGKESYDYLIYHNAPNTNSNVVNNGVNKSGSMNIQISGYVPKYMMNCICNQSNRIINLTDRKCEIRPNLYIDTDDVDANHSALIGKFNNDELFYLNSRGINDIDANNLLIKGFLLNKVDSESFKENIKADIDKYWR